MFSNYTSNSVSTNCGCHQHFHTLVTPGVAVKDNYGNVVKLQWTPLDRFSVNISSDSWVPVVDGSIVLENSGQTPDAVAGTNGKYAYNTSDYKCWRYLNGVWEEQSDVVSQPGSKTMLLFSNKSGITRVVIKNFRGEQLHSVESVGNSVSLNVDNTLADKLLQGYYNADVYLIDGIVTRFVRRISISVGNYTEDVPPDNSHGHPCHHPNIVPPNANPEEDARNDWELSRAFLSVSTIAERDSLDSPSLPHGKMVRVSNTPEGVKYYSWNQITYTWTEEHFNSDTPIVIVDSKLSKDSENPVQNKVITQALEDVKKNVGIPDWNQNDPSAPGYVKNRTHYQDEKEIIFVDGTVTCEVVLFEEKGESFYMYEPYVTPFTGYKFSEGDIVTITVNGVTEEVPVVVGDKEGVHFYYALSSSLRVRVEFPDYYPDSQMFSDTGISIRPEESPDSSGQAFSALVKISTVSNTIVKLPNEYIDSETYVKEGSGKPVTSDAVAKAIVESRVQPDASQMDQLAPDYIKNMPYSAKIYERLTFPNEGERVGKYEWVSSDTDFPRDGSHIFGRSNYDSSKNIDRWLTYADYVWHGDDSNMDNCATYWVDFPCGKIIYPDGVGMDIDGLVFNRPGLWLEWYVVEYSGNSEEGYDYWEDTYTLSTYSGIEIPAWLISKDIARVSDISDSVLNDEQTQELLSELEGYVEEEITSE